MLTRRDNQLKESFTDVLFKGLSKDGGLFLPCKFPNIDINEILLTPRETVSELDKYIVGQAEAKKAVSMPVSSLAKFKTFS